MTKWTICTLEGSAYVDIGYSTVVHFPGSIVFIGPSFHAQLPLCTTIVAAIPAGASFGRNTFTPILSHALQSAPFWSISFWMRT